MPTNYTEDYIGKTQYFGIDPISNLNTGELYKQTILSVGDKYQIDISAQMKTWKQEETPFLTLLSNLGTASTDNPYHVWGDEYMGDTWVDIALDDLRLMDTKETDTPAPGLPIPNSGLESKYRQRMVAVDSASYVGGSFAFLGATTTAFNTTVKNICTVITAAQAAAAGVMNTALATGSADDNFIAFKAPASGIVGSSYKVFNLLRQYASLCGYNISTDNKIVFSNDTSMPLYFAFDDIYFKDSTGILNKEEVLLRIEAITNTGGVLIFLLNVSNSNEPSLATASKVLIANQAIGAEDAHFAGLISHPSRMVQIGLPVINQPGNPEGDTFVDGGNLNFSRERKTNYVEIFRSKAYGITGTHQASKFRFGDDFAKTREMHMALYKRQVNYKLITGVRSETVATNTKSDFANGQPIRTLGGFLDYSLFPINYKKVPLANFSDGNTSDSAYTALNEFIDRIANGTFAFRNSQGSKNISLSCSKAFLRRLSPYVNYALGSKNMGGQIQIQQPSSITFGLKVLTFTSTDGVTVNFVHEPSLDYMVRFPLAYHQFGTGSVNPKDILLNIDYANVKKVTFRNDRIMGNIQQIGQDAFKEGIMGDHTFELNFPKNHSVIYCPAE